MRESIDIRAEMSQLSPTAIGNWRQSVHRYIEFIQQLSDAPYDEQQQRLHFLHIGDEVRVRCVPDNDASAAVGEVEGTVMAMTATTASISCRVSALRTLGLNLSPPAQQQQKKQFTVDNTDVSIATVASGATDLHPLVLLNAKKPAAATDGAAAGEKSAEWMIISVSLQDIRILRTRNGVDEVGALEHTECLFMPDQILRCSHALEETLAGGSMQLSEWTDKAVIVTLNDLLQVINKVIHHQLPVVQQSIAAVCCPSVPTTAEAAEGPTAEEMLLLRHWGQLLRLLYDKIVCLNSYLRPIETSPAVDKYVGDAKNAEDLVQNFDGTTTAPETAMKTRGLLSSEGTTEMNLLFQHAFEFSIINDIVELTRQLPVPMLILFSTWMRLLNPLILISNELSLLRKTCRSINSVHGELLSVTLIDQVIIAVIDATTAYYDRAGQHWIEFINSSLLDTILRQEWSSNSKFRRESGPSHGIVAVTSLLEKQLWQLQHCLHRSCGLTTTKLGLKFVLNTFVAVISCYCRSIQPSRVRHWQWRIDLLHILYCVQDAMVWLLQMDPLVDVQLSADVDLQQNTAPEVLRELVTALLLFQVFVHIACEATGPSSAEQLLRQQLSSDAVATNEVGIGEGFGCWKECLRCLSSNTAGAELLFYLWQSGVEENSSTEGKQVPHAATITPATTKTVAEEQSKDSPAQTAASHVTVAASFDEDETPFRKPEKAHWNISSVKQFNCNPAVAMTCFSSVWCSAAYCGFHPLRIFPYDHHSRRSDGELSSSGASKSDDNGDADTASYSINQCTANPNAADGASGKSYVPDSLLISYTDAQQEANLTSKAAALELFQKVYNEKRSYMAAHRAVMFHRVHNMQIIDALAIANSLFFDASYREAEVVLDLSFILFESGDSSESTMKALTRAAALKRLVRCALSLRYEVSDVSEYPPLSAEEAGRRENIQQLLQELSGESSSSRCS